MFHKCILSCTEHVLTRYYNLLLEKCYIVLEEYPCSDYVDEVEALFTIDLAVEDCDCEAEDVVMM